MFCRSILDEIVSWQEECLRALGWDPADKLRLSRVNFEAKLSKHPEQERQSIREGFNRFWTTKYQDPIILGGIAGDWDEAERLASRLWPEKMYRPRQILLATVPFGFLNGLANRDVQGRCAVVLSEGLRFWPSVLANSLIPFLVEESETAMTINTDPEALKTKLLAKPEFTAGFIGTFLHDLTNSEILQRVIQNWNRLICKPASSELSTILNEVLSFFCVLMK